MIQNYYFLGTFPKKGNDCGNVPINFYEKMFLASLIFLYIHIRKTNH